MAIQIQLRRDTTANWTSVNPILADGEEGFEINTRKRKVGDGVTAWNDLEYAIVGITDETDPVFTEWLETTPPAYPSAIPTALSALSDDETHRLVTDTEKTSWNNKEAAGVAATLDEAVLTDAKEYADGLVIGLWDDRGSFDASINTYPVTGGSGVDGAILKGDIWTISVIAASGVLLGYPAGTTIRALSDAPAQVSGNWAVSGSGLGYTPENAANKATTINNSSTDVQYPSAKAVNDKVNAVLGWFNILSYGASTGATAAANTTAINAAITAAAAVGGIVYVPAGTYSVNTIVFNTACSLIGDNAAGSILKSASAVPLLTYYGDYNTSYTKISDITFDGNNVGTVGMDLYRTNNFNFTNLWFKNFTSYCIKFKGVLIGNFNNCLFLDSYVGIYAENYSSMQSNLVAFNFVRWYNVSHTSIDWRTAAGLIFNECNWEVCGQANNATTGVIQLQNMSPASEGITFAMDKCWAELNHNTFLRINNPNGNSRYKIQNSILQFNTSGTYGIYVVANSTYKNEIIIESSTISGFTTKDIVADGANASISYLHSTISTSQMLNSGIIVAESASPETATTIGALIGASDNATPNDTDFVATSLTAGGILKKITWTNVKAFLKTYFDKLYQSVLVSGTNIKTINGSSILGSGNMEVAGTGGISDAPSDENVYGRKNAGWEVIAGGTGEIWTVISAAYASANTITVAGNDKTVALAQFSLFTCTDSAGTTRRYGFVKSSVNNSGTITHTIVSTSNLAAGDKYFRIAYNRKIHDYQHVVSVPGQLTASATESLGVWKLNIRAASKFISSDIAAITPAVGTGAALAWNVYSGASALYSTAPDATTNSVLEDQRPTTIDIAKGANISVRFTSVGGATNYPADVQVTLFIVPDLIWIAFTGEELPI